MLQRTGCGQWGVHRRRSGQDPAEGWGRTGEPRGRNLTGGSELTDPTPSDGTPTSCTNHTQHPQPHPQPHPSIPDTASFPPLSPLLLPCLPQPRPPFTTDRGRTGAPLAVCLLPPERVPGSARGPLGLLHGRGRPHPAGGAAGEPASVHRRPLPDPAPQVQVPADPWWPSAPRHPGATRGRGVGEGCR